MANAAKVFIRTKGRAGLVEAAGEKFFFPGRRMVSVEEIDDFLRELGKWPALKPAPRKFTPGRPQGPGPVAYEGLTRSACNQPGVLPSVPRNTRATYAEVAAGVRKVWRPVKPKPGSSGVEEPKAAAAAVAEVSTTVGGRRHRLEGVRARRRRRYQPARHTCQTLHQALKAGWRPAPLPCAKCSCASTSAADTASLATDAPDELTPGGAPYTPAFAQEAVHAAIPLAPPSEDGRQSKSEPISTRRRPTPTGRGRRTTSNGPKPQSVDAVQQAREDRREAKFSATPYGDMIKKRLIVEQKRKELLQAEVDAGLAAQRAGVCIPLDDGDVETEHPLTPDRDDSAPVEDNKVVGADVPSVVTASTREPTLPKMYPARGLDAIEPCAVPLEPASLDVASMPCVETEIVDWQRAMCAGSVVELGVADKTSVAGFREASFNSNLQPYKHGSLVSPYKLSGKQAAALLKVLGGDPSTWAVHPDAAPHEHPVLALLRSALDSALANVYRGMSVKDVGGNPIRHLRAGHTNVHCCTPVVTPADALRIVKWRADAAHNNYRLKDVCSCEMGVTWCQNTGATCPAEAQVLYCLDVIYYLGEAHWVHLMQQVDMGIVVYHRFDHQYNAYLTDAKVRVHKAEGGEPWVRMDVPGNPVPYVHRYINLGEPGMLDRSTKIFRNGQPLCKTVIAKLADVHVVLYYWGVLPMRVDPSARGPYHNRDLRGMSTPAGVTIKDHVDKLQLREVTIRWDRVDWYGESAVKIEDSLFSKFAGRVSTFVDINTLQDAVSEQFRVEMQRVNITDEESLTLRPATVRTAVARLVHDSLLAAGGAIKPTISLGIGRILAQTPIQRLHPRVPFGSFVESSLILSLLPFIPLDTTDDGTWDLDMLTTQAVTSGRVFRLAGPPQTNAMRIATAGRATQRGVSNRSSVLLTVICATGGLLIIAKSAVYVTALLRSSVSPSGHLLSRTCASVTNGCLLGLAYLGISRLR